MFQNKWAESTIFKTCADYRKLSAKYPDNVDPRKCDWFVAVVPGDTGSYRLMEKAAEHGWVVGKWRLPFHSQWQNQDETGDSLLYAVGIYCPDGWITRMQTEIGIEIEELNLGVDRIVELGMNPFHTPMIGAANWGNGIVA